MKTIKDYKADARKCMKNGFGLSVAVWAAFLALQYVLSFIMTFAAGDSQVLLVAYEILYLIISIIIIAPITVGLYRFFIEQAHGRVDVNNVFYSFKTNHMNIVKIGFIREVKVFFWLLIPVAIGLIAVIGVAMAVGIGSSVAGLSVFGLSTGNDDLEMTIFWILYAIVIVLMIPGIIKALDYTMIDFILAENPDITTKEAFAMSKEMMSGNRLRWIGLSLSFVGWILLGLIACGIGIIFVVPYMSAAQTQFYLDAKNRIGCEIPESEIDYFGENKDNGDTFGL